MGGALTRQVPVWIGRLRPEALLLVCEVAHGRRWRAGIRRLAPCASGSAVKPGRLDLKGGAQKVSDGCPGAQVRRRAIRRLAKPPCLPALGISVRTTGIFAARTGAWQRVGQCITSASSVGRLSEGWSVIVHDEPRRGVRKFLCPGRRQDEGPQGKAGACPATSAAVYLAPCPVRTTRRVRIRIRKSSQIETWRT